MRLVVEWTTHKRRYSIDAVEFLKNAGIEITDDQLKATAKKLLEQNGMEPEEPQH